MFNFGVEVWGKREAAGLPEFACFRRHFPALFFNTNHLKCFVFDKLTN